MEAGLLDGSKLNVDASLIDANAAKESVIKAAFLGKAEAASLSQPVPA